MTSKARRILIPRVPRIVVWLAVLLLAAAAAAAGQDAPPRILLDQSPRAIQYQLDRLSDERLAQVERRADDPRYVPVYYALLTRPGLPQAVRDEAVSALTTLEKTSATGVLLSALGRVTGEHAAAADAIAHMLVAQSPIAIEAASPALEGAIAQPSAAPAAVRAAYAAILLTGGPPDSTWSAAAARDGHLAHLLAGARYLPSTPGTAALRADLAARASDLLRAPATEASAGARRAAIDVLPHLRPDSETFALLSTVVMQGDGEETTDAVRALTRVPRAAWPAETIEPLARSLVSRLAALPPDRRTEPDAIDAIQLAGDLAGAIPGASGTALLAEVRAIGVQVVRLEAVFEEVRFNRRWFAVEAGKPVQIVFFNPDAMPHNVVVGVPGSLERIGTAGGAMPMPSDPAVKPFVPNLPEVLQATALITQGETARLGFTAPAIPGEYVFVCTFPGHWVRMYGVMLVVADFEAWEAAPAAPRDPMTGQPMAADRTE